MNKKPTPQPSTISWKGNKKIIKKIKRKYHSTSTYRPYDSTHGFKLKREHYEDGYKRLTLTCLDCESFIEIHLMPDESCPMVEIDGVLLGYDSFKRLFSEIIHEMDFTQAKKFLKKDTI